jgi:hypothetical protein
MSTTMVNSYLGCFIALFRHAVREHGLPGNPFEGLRVREAKAGAAMKRRSFTEGELRPGGRDDLPAHRSTGPGHGRLS